MDTLQKSIRNCEQEIGTLDDPRWPRLMDAIREGVEANKRQHEGDIHSAEIIIVINQDYYSVLQSILTTAKLYATKSTPDAQGK